MGSELIENQQTKKEKKAMTAGVKRFLVILCMVLCILSMGLTLLCLCWAERSVYSTSKAEGRYNAAYDIAYENADVILGWQDEEEDMRDAYLNSRLENSNIYYAVYFYGEDKELGDKELLVAGTTYGNSSKSYEYVFEFFGESYDTVEIADWEYEGRYAVKCNVPYESEVILQSHEGRMDDLARIYSFLRMGDRFGYLCLCGAIAGWLAGLILLAVLICHAGRKNEDQTWHLSFVDRIPMDFYLLLMFGAAILFLVLVDYADLVTQSIEGFCVGFFGVSVLAIPLVVLSFMTLSVRIKAGTLWKNNVLVYVGKWLEKQAKRVYRLMREHFSVIWRGMALYLLVVFVEVVVMLLAVDYFFGWYWGTEPFIVCFIIVKLVSVGVVFVLLIWLHRLQEGAERIAGGNLDYQIDTGKMIGAFKQHGETLSTIRDGIQAAVNEQLKSERLKGELLTNVSHDIKTPLTSIINYVDLLQKKEPEDPEVKEYLEVLSRQSARLKKLTEDLIEASKASTGALPVQLEPCEVGVLLEQAAGEYEEKLAELNLNLVVRKPEEEIKILADGKHLWRVFDNLLNNILKYAQPGTRVYLDLEKQAKSVSIIFRNTSREALSRSGEELQERFVRGDSSRNTEGSGLGLSIAKSLTELMNGRFELTTDGDLFKVVLVFSGLAAVH
ncbi:MAG: HAMP domain-containing histidine kinase [Lachnospiraceae bacterium]|nr:HAMP domain-containing histidine kinase [Lachnospiraceae bacterium]